MTLISQRCACFLSFFFWMTGAGYVILVGHPVSNISRMQTRHPPATETNPRLVWRKNSPSYSKWREKSKISWVPFAMPLKKLKSQSTFVSLSNWRILKSISLRIVSYISVIVFVYLWEQNSHERERVKGTDCCWSQCRTSCQQIVVIGDRRRKYIQYFDCL